MNISFSLCFSIIAAENFKSLAFAAFTCIVNFKILNFMRLQKIIIKNTKSKLNVFNVVHVMRHVYMAGTDNLLKDKFFILKIRRKSFKGLVINRGRKIFFWIWKFGKLLRAVAFKAQNAGFLICNKQALSVFVCNFRIDVSAHSKVVNWKSPRCNNFAPVRASFKMNLSLCKDPEVIEFFAVNNAVASHCVKTFSKIVLNHKHGLGNAHAHC